jgi:dTDP-4-dehydrorhamnose 3,5-epimerase
MIHDVEVRNLQMNVDERGSLTEIWRDDWEFYQGGDEPEMSYFSVSDPGAIRAWHRHNPGVIDHFVVPRGMVKIAVYDDRESSPTQNELDTYFIGEKHMKAVRVPGDCWHGFKIIGDKQAVLMNFLTNLYDYENSDEEQLPHDTDKIPLDWEEAPSG